MGETIWHKQIGTRPAKAHGRAFAKWGTESNMNGVGLSQGTWNRVEVTEPKPFNLVRYFALTCLVLFVVITSVMCTAFFQISRNYIKKDAEDHGIFVAEHLARISYGSSGHFPRRGSSAYKEFVQRIQDLQEPLQIRKVKVYSIDKRLIYVTDPTIPLGTPDLGNDKLNQCLSGEIVSTLQTEDSLWDLPREKRFAGAIVETYIPVKDPETGVIVSVFEIYQDVSVAYGRLPGITLFIVGASILAMGVLYVFLFIVTQKGHNIILEQTRTIRIAKANLESYANDLEQRVDQRTQQLRETMAQQNQDEKMVVAGTLAAGVAHELNTPLSTILGAVEMVRDHVTEGLKHSKDQHHRHLDQCPQCEEDLSQIETQTKRCVAIIRNLVGFSRKSNEDRDVEDLRNLVELSLLLVQPKANLMGVNFNADLDKEIPPVIVNGNEIQQVLVNIMNNGIDAMEEGGTLSVSIHANDSTVGVEIADSGVGMDEDVQRRMFEPFFTSKQAGKGTGLGLAVSYRIIADHGGSIHVSSTPGKGSKFTITLPLSGETLK